MKKRDLFILGAAMLVVAIIAGNDARNVLDRLNSADSLTKYSGPVDLVFSGCARYRLWRGSCYVDFRLSGGPSVGFRYHDDRENYETIRSAIRKGRRFTVTSKTST